MPTAIEWCDETFNPWWGCEKVSPGCAHCYAEGVSNHRAGKGLWGAGHAYRFFGEKHWDEPLRWARTLPAKLGRRPRVFCASMADVFEEGGIAVEGARRRFFDLILRTPELDWLVLTKRPEFARDWLPEVELFALTTDWPIKNLWLGVSIENSRFTWRAEVLREIPAALRFISAEPLLGSLFASAVICGGCLDLETELGTPPTSCDVCAGRGTTRAPLDLRRIDWVIVGGESGPKARPMHPDWARELRDASHGDRPGPAFLFKQWGEWSPGSNNGRDLFIGPDGFTSKDIWNDPRLLPDRQADGHTDRWRSLVWMGKRGKKAAGRVLDGRTWDEFPRSPAFVEEQLAFEAPA